MNVEFIWASKDECDPESFPVFKKKSNAYTVLSYFLLEGQITIYRRLYRYFYRAQLPHCEL